jgi:hypothetical protein
MQTEVAQAGVLAHMAGPAFERLPAMHTLSVELTWLAAKSQGPQANVHLTPLIAIALHRNIMITRS